MRAARRVQPPTRRCVQTNKRLGRAYKIFLGDSRSEQSTPVGSLLRANEFRLREEHIEALGLPRTANYNWQHGISFRVTQHFQTHRFINLKRGTNDKHANAAAQAFVDATSRSLCTIATFFFAQYLRRKYGCFLKKLFLKNSRICAAGITERLRADEIRTVDVLGIRVCTITSPFCNVFAYAVTT